MMKLPRPLLAICVLFTSTALMSCTSPGAKVGSESGQIVMVCEHGSVKSLMAASLFNRRAVERQLPVRAVARGVRPDASVPAPIADALARDGFDVHGFVPMQMSVDEVAHASRVIAIGVEPAALNLGPRTRIETWSDVPAASVDYAAARASLEQHVEQLLDDLQR